MDADADAVTGPPDGMADRRDELTPMLGQYFDCCADYPDAILLFQNGDFYQTYCDAAEEVARVCELTLTRREDSTGTYPMAGIPVENAATYVEDLLDAGYRVAVAEQVEDPGATSGLVERAVTRVVTPGTVVDDELLAPGTANYVAAVTREAGDGDADGDADGDGIGEDGTDGETPDPERGTWALAAVDVATGECLVTAVDDRAGLVAELDRLAPAEVLVGPGTTLDTETLAAAPTLTDHPAAEMDRDAAADRLSAYVPRPGALVESDAELRACGAVLAYAEWTQGGDGPLDYVTRVTRHDPRDALGLDATALRSLELFENRGTGASETLFGVLDDTACALGRRALDSWLRRPLVDRERIEARHDAVTALVADGVARDALREALRDVYDLERLAGRVSRGRADARDLRSLAETLAAVPAVRSAVSDVLADADGEVAPGACDTDALDPDALARLHTLHDAADPLDDVCDLIDRAIRPDPPVEVTEGGLIREGFDDELDDLRRTEREGREWVARLEEHERERTGIDSLSVGHNQVHGYYIEVTDANLDRVPDDYTRRQTLKNAERFYTPELKRREDEILGAAERADSLEYELFREVREAVAAETDRLQALADALAELDVLSTLAAVAVERDYVRPEFHAGDAGRGGIDIAAGRHPVVEATREHFVPNDATLPPGSVTLVTGPNMSGKSTYMRGVALVVIMAQMGGFVPADATRLPVVDRVFTRVGASDDIAGGQSTFMREMAELTDILHEATADSLVLLDEVGRGTSTADGFAIARATAEFVHDEVGATTLFATHYHDLTALADGRERVRNVHFTADRDGADVTFLHRVADGPASSSYGIEVARMAGVPRPVVERARDLVDAASGTGGGDPAPATDGDVTDPATDGDAAHPTGAGSTDPATNGHDASVGGGDDAVDDGRDASPDEAPAADRAASDPVAARLRGVDLATTTPIEALNLLADLQAEVERE